MKFMQLAVMAALFFLAGFNAAAQQDKPLDLAQRAEEEADRLQRVLNLEDWQVFYVDSTLKHDLPAWMDESNKLQASKVTNSSLYMAVSDKWMDQIDATYKKIFTPEQWALYLKSGAGKAMKAREKRKEKAEASK